MRQEAQECPGNWCPENYARIREALGCLPEGGGPLAAVFDFDNTCVFRDIGQAVFRAQLADLRFRIAPETLAALIPENGPDGDPALEGRPWTGLRAAALEHYRTLWPYIQTGRIAEAQATPAYPAFTALLYWLAASARRSEALGPRYVLGLLARLQAGHRLSELREFCADVLNRALAEPLAEAEFAARLPEPLGVIAAAYPTGFAPFADMRDLMRVLQARGVACSVVSASSEWLVRTAAPLLGFPLAPDHIFGVRANMAGDLVLPEDAPDYPITWRAGKNEVIDRFIRRRPWLVAGDADTDYDMLTRPDAELRLVINRRLGGRIAELYRRPDILVQGIDLERGCFCPSRETVLP